MGSDIHVICQVKENGRWVKNLKAIFPNPDAPMVRERLAETEKELADLLAGESTDDLIEVDMQAIDLHVADPTDPVAAKLLKINQLQSRIEYFKERVNEEKDFVDDPEDGRWYDWFAVLADVRNGRGFAGVKTGEGFESITSKRGLPEGFSVDVYEESEEDSDDIEGVMEQKFMGDHSFGWASVDEIANHNWNLTTEKEGEIPLEEYKQYRGTNNSPEEWIHNLGSQTVLSMKEADDLLDGHTSTALMQADQPIYVHYKWQITYKDWFKEKLKNWLDPMLELKKEYEDVRVVFGFDS